METYIAFLRAINVGGRTVKMDRLRELFAGLGLEGVRTYIQSGNVFFRTAETDRAALAARIEAGLADGLGYPVPVMLRTVEEVEALLALDPFAAVEPAEDKRLCVLFLSEPLPDEVAAALPVASPKGDWEMVGATADAAFVVMYVRNGRLNGNPATAFPKSYRGQATSRFFHTTAKIAAAARKG
ncbi:MULTISPECIES: DUF1697 domain-containing protein [Kitasatospora]|uniref:DUF1697 domain-containing protein n=1 Tax=Kitasatospora TaxID=2063 RepID=UPI0004C3C8B6|nr:MULTISPECIES: DUF1697 domain-containing protein [unclassified Kitasatospora]WAL71519.1 DUF1697 domain-containing protein [Kitasatospora sp. YST-16]WNW37559.1 DUF1697 domain-containing protein [Streptomyces sp. Li-HN-5-13]